MSDPVDTPGEVAAPPDEAAEAGARAAALERRIAELEASMNERVIRAELKAEALRAGMVDLDGIKLIDTASLALDDRGEVRGGAGLMRDLRRAKPWLFGAATTSSTAAAPAAHQPKTRLAADMSYDEWQEARAALVKRR